MKRPGYVGDPAIIAFVRELRAAGMSRKDIILYVHHIWEEHCSDECYANHTYRVAPRYDENIVLGREAIVDGADYAILNAMHGHYSYIDNDINSICGTYSVPGVGSVYDDRLIRLLRMLTAEERKVCVLYYVYGFTQRDISRGLKLSEDTINRIISKIKKQNNT